MVGLPGPTPGARSSNIVWDGKMLQEVNFGVAAFATAAVNNVGRCIVPCDGEIVQALVRITASSTSSLAKVNVGKNGTANNLLNSYSVTNVAADTVRDVISSALWATKSVDRGDVLALGLDAATAAGSVAVGLIIRPR